MNSGGQCGGMQRLNAEAECRGGIQWQYAEAVRRCYLEAVCKSSVQKQYLEHIWRRYPEAEVSKATRLIWVAEQDVADSERFN